MGEMQPESDAQLLRAYAERGAETAFTELVHRHTNLVYSAAWRQVESPEAAAEIAQRVFIGLARGAQDLVPRLAAEASLAGWLCRSARNLALNHRRDKFRRQTRERQVMEELLTTSDAAPDWERLRRVLDDALAELNEADYDALVLRFFQQQDYRTVGVALGVSDDTAQKRVTRALETLRDHLSQRGIRTTAAALSLVITANAVQAAPVGLAATLSAAALLAGTTASTGTVMAATKTIAMTTLQKTLVTAALAVVAGVGIYEAHQASRLREQNRSLQQQQMPQTEQVKQLQRERDEATNQLASVIDELAKANSHNLELLKLRGEVGVLRNQLAMRTTAPSAASLAAGIKPTAHRPGSYISKDQLNNAGYSTPEAAFETETWSIINSNYEQALECFLPNRKADELKRPQNREDFMKAGELASIAITGVQIMAKKILSDDQAELKIKQFINLEKFKEYIAKYHPPGVSPNLLPEIIITVEPFTKIDNEWKCSQPPPAYDEKWDINGQVQTFAP